MVEQLAVEREAAAVLGKGRGILEIAQVLRQDRLPILEEAEGILELAAHPKTGGDAAKPSGNAIGAGA